MRTTLTGAAQLLQAPAEWPDQPYKGLNFYNSADCHLFAERDGDIERCADILESTHVLFLHGRSGVGKSSFLRAGLVPFVERHGSINDPGIEKREPRLQGIRVPGENEALILRCTEDPVRRLYLKLGGRTPWQDTDPRSDAKETALLLFKRAREMNSRCPLYFVIDQAEDVLNLNSRGSPNQQRFVRLIDILRFRGEVKLILSLRTEFFGNFLDLMSVSPTELGLQERPSEALPPLSGIDMFLLDSIREQSRLVNIIEFPAKNTDKYKFEFEDGLALRIAGDLNKETNDFNLLPTLQVVCKELYDDVVVKRETNVIRTEDYTRRGGVRGGIDAFINRNLDEVLNENGRTSGVEEIGKWKTVLGSLVGRSEAGSVVGLLKRAPSIEGVAQREEVVGAGTQGSTLMVLQGLGQEHRRVLRIVPDMEGGVWYGLGHDALAPALFAWVDAAEQRATERRQSEDRWLSQKKAIEREREKEKLAFELEREKEKLESRARIAHAWYLSAAAMIIVIGGFIGYCVLIFDSYKSVSKAALTLAKTRDTPEFRVKALRLGQALIATEGLFRVAIDRTGIESQLRELLLSSPVWAALGNSVATDISERKLLFIRGGDLLSKPASSADEPLLVGHMPKDWEAEVGPTSIGLVSGIPVVIRGRKMFFQKGAGGGLDLGEFDLTTIVPVSLEDANFWPEVSGNAVRLYFFSTFSPLKIVILSSGDISKIVSSGAFRRKNIGDIAELSGPGPRPIPLFSADNKQLAVISGGIAADAVLTRGFLQSDNRWVFGSQAIAPPALRRPGPDVPGSPFYPVATFVGASGVLLVRDRADTLALRSATNWSMKQLKVDNAMQGFLPSGWGFMRPPLAAFASDTKLRVAWATREGIAVGEANSSVRDVSFVKNLFWGESPPQRVSFSGDGEHLYGVFRTDEGQQQGLYWDISPDRKSVLSELNGISLVAETCRVVSLVGATSLTESERLQAIPITLPEPCKG